jgi:hypothetical protein
MESTASENVGLQHRPGLVVSPSRETFEILCGSGLFREGAGTFKINVPDRLLSRASPLPQGALSAIESQAIKKASRRRPLFVTPRVAALPDQQL